MTDLPTRQEAMGFITKTKAWMAEGDSAWLWGIEDDVLSAYAEGTLMTQEEWLHTLDGADD